MKANELRLGNWVYNPVQKKELKADVRIISSVFHDNRRGVTKEFRFQPIPVTEEWLIRFGFKQEKTEDILYYFKENDDCVSFGLYRLSEEEWELYTGSKTIKYIHEVQNLYFALCGEELNCSKKEK